MTQISADRSAVQDTRPGGSTTPERVMLVYGTRPEAIKMAPLVRELERSPLLSPIVVLTGQHHVDAGAGQHRLRHRGRTTTSRSCSRGQSLHRHHRALPRRGLAAPHERATRLVLVQGDTTSAFAAALAAFYAQVPVVHLEAGLRTDDLYSPLPAGDQPSAHRAARLAPPRPHPDQPGQPAAGERGQRRGSSSPGTRSSTRCCGRWRGPAVPRSPPAGDRQRRTAGPAGHRPPPGVLG